MTQNHPHKDAMKQYYEIKIATVAALAIRWYRTDFETRVVVI
jgi:hypothetical protein